MNSKIIPEVLLVDDLPANLLVLEEILAPCDVKIIKVTSGAEALRVTLSQQVALILLDVQMPRMDGYETARLLRGSERTRRIPIIFVTASSQESEHVFQGYESGAIDYLFKPLAPAIVRSKVNVFSELYRLQQQEVAEVKILEDLRNRIELERRENQSLTNLKSILNHLQVGVLLFDVKDGRVSFANKQVEIQLKHHFLTGNVTEEFHEYKFCFRDGKPYLPDQFPSARALKGETIEGEEITYQRLDGTRTLFHTSAKPLRDENNVITSAIVCFQDVTQRVRLEEELHQVKKMEAIGKLASGVAHEFNNLIHSISTSVKLALLDIEDAGKIAAHLARAQIGCGRAADITAKLLTFGRKDKIAADEIDVRTVIDESIAIVSPLLGENINFECVRSDLTLGVIGDKGMLVHVFMNLFLNARDAMPNGGEISLRSEIVPLGLVDCRAYNLKPGDHVKLIITDTGQGIPHDVIEKIFDPFFTTKEAGKGTGLGLSTVTSIVQQHRGKIHVTSVVNQGTKFEIFLPLQQLTQVALNSTAKIAEEKWLHESHRGQTILIADDDELVRDVCEITLKRAGYRVIATTNGKEAVAAFHENKDQIGLVVLDAMMPVMGGKAAGELMKKVAPELPIIFCTGYDSLDNETLNKMAGNGFVILNKPYEDSVLLESVREHLSVRPLLRKSA